MKTEAIYLLLEQAQASLEAVRADRDRWKALAGEMAEALAFYADPGQYHAITFFTDPPCGGFAGDFSEDHGDASYDRPMPGKIARTALTAYTQAIG